MRILKSLGLIGVMALMGLPVPAEAGILGAVVDVMAEYPTIGSVYADGGVKTVDGTIEYPVGSFAGYNGCWSVDLADTQILLSCSTGSTFVDATFNGFDILFVSGSITNAVANGSSGFNPADISISGNHLYLNYQGVSAPASSTSIIDVQGTGGTGVPEPSSIALLGAGLIGLRVLRHRYARMKV